MLFVDKEAVGIFDIVFWLDSSVLCVYFHHPLFFSIRRMCKLTSQTDVFANSIIGTLLQNLSLFNSFIVIIYSNPC